MVRFLIFFLFLSIAAMPVSRGSSDPDEWLLGTGGLPPKLGGYELEVSEDLLLIRTESPQAGYNVLNISDPSEPVWVTNIYDDMFSADPWWTQLDNGILYLMDKSSVTSIALDNPAAPERRGCYNDLELEDFAVDGTVGYAVGKSGLTVYDIQDPYQFRKLLEYPLYSGADEVWVCENRLYLAGDDGVRIFDRTSPENPVIRSTIPSSCILGAVSQNRIVVQNRLFWRNFEIWNVSDPVSPFRELALDLYVKKFIDLSSDSNRLVLEYGVQLLGMDISDPASIELLWILEETEGSGYAIRDDTLYRTSSGVEIFRLTGNNAPEMIGQYAGPSPIELTAMVVGDNALTIASTESEIVAFDTRFRDPRATLMRMEGSFTCGVFINTTTAAICQPDGLGIYDFSHPEIPVKLALCPEIHFIEKAVESNGFLAALRELPLPQISIVDVRNSAEPVMTGQIIPTEIPVDIAIDAEVVYVLDRAGGLTAYPVSGSHEPAWQITIETDNYSNFNYGDLEISGDVIYANSNREVFGIERTGLDPPARIEALFQVYSTQQISTDYPLMAIYHSNAIAIYRLDDPWHPQKLYDDSGSDLYNSTDFMFRDKQLYIMKSPYIRMFSWDPTPEIEMAGWQVMRPGSEATLRCLAKAPDARVRRVEIFYEGRTGLLLNDDGAAGDTVPNDGIYTWEWSVDRPDQKVQIPLKLILTDQYGRDSTWPKLVVRP